MSVNEIRLKLLVAVERFLRRWADHLSSVTSQLSQPGGAPKDWLERVRRAGPMMGQTVPPPVESLPGGDGSSEAPRAGGDSSGPLLETTVWTADRPVHSIPPARPELTTSSASSAPVFPKWRRPLKLRPPVHSSSRSRDASREPVSEPSRPAGSPGSDVAPSSPHPSPAHPETFIPEGAKVPVEERTPVQPRPLLPPAPSVEFPAAFEAQHEHKIHYGERKEHFGDAFSWERAGAHRRFTEVNYGRMSSPSAAMLEWNPGKPPVSDAVESTRRLAEEIPTDLEFERSRQAAQNAVPLEWDESPPEGWPELPEERTSEPENENRIGRLLEQRTRIDREQNGLTWNARRF